ncbi:endonuclease/exonuclease/phosphatase family protein [Kaarinaea lacus]
MLKKTLRISLLLFLGVSWILPISAHERDGRSSGPIKVMTQNLYIGADLLRVVDVNDPAEIPIAVAETLQIIQQTNFPERAKAIAEQIKRIKPDVIGLQEVTLLRTQFPGDFFLGNPVAAEEVLYDYLDILLATLSEQGMHYQVAAIVQNADVEVPAFAGVDEYGNPVFMDVRLTDHDVILARKSIKTKNPLAQNYQINLQIPIDSFVIEFTRGYTTVDAKVRGHWYRVANTHLELPGPAPVSLVQAMQTQELIGVLSQSELPVVLLGDFNSSPEDVVDPRTGAVPPYMQLVASNFADIWLHRFGRPAMGYTCCQDELLNNESSLLSMRIDHIFVRSTDGDPTVLDEAFVLANTIGDRAIDKTASGLWPSDHAGVWARIKFIGPRWPFQELHWH